MNFNYPGIWFTERHIEIGFVNDLPLEKREHWKSKSMVVVTIVFVLILWRLRAILQKYVAQKFYQEKYDYKKALAEFSGIVASCLDQQHLTNDVIHKLCNLMHLKNIGIMVSKNGNLLPADSLGFVNEKWQKVHFQVKASWLKQLALEGRPRSLEQVTPKEKALLKELGAYFLAPIAVNGKLLGLFVLGEKLSEDHYRVEDIELLEAAASQTGVALENVNLYKELQETERLKKELQEAQLIRLENVTLYKKLQEQEHLREELQVAHKIQISSLPKKVPDIPGLDIFATSNPATEVGGDYYDFFRYEDQQLMSIVGDVSGKGMSAALYVAKVQGIMRSIYANHSSPAELFIKLNELLCEEIEKNYFITQVGVKLDLKKQTATLVRAGHAPILYYDCTKDVVQFIESPGMGLCLSSPDEFKRQLQEVTLSFKSGDIFVLYSDGVTDARDEQGMEFGEQRLLDTLSKLTNRSAPNIGHTIITAVETFTKGAKHFDDMTVCVVKIK